METMICTKCNVEQSIEEFSLYKSRGKTLRRRICKNCISAYKRVHYQNNKEKYLDKARRQRERDPEGYKQYLRNYYYENRETLLQKMRDYNTSEHGRKLNR